MKTILLSIILVITFGSITGQNVEQKKEVYNPGDYVPPKFIDSTQSNVQDAANHMIMFANGAQAGIAMEIAGSALAIYASQSDSEQKNIMTAGGLFIGVAGFIIHTISYSHMRQAGNLLKVSDKIVIKPSSEGVGIAIPIK